MILHLRTPSGIDPTDGSIVGGSGRHLPLALELRISNAKDKTHRCPWLKVDNGGRPFPIEFHTAHGMLYASIEFPDACKVCIRVDERLANMHNSGHGSRVLSVNTLCGHSEAARAFLGCESLAGRLGEHE